MLLYNIRIDFGAILCNQDLQLRMFKVVMDKEPCKFFHL